MAAKRRMDFSKLPRHVLEKNETLFCEGDPGAEMYVLLTGELGVFRGGERLITLSTPMSIVGEMSALTGAARAATVQALKHSTLIVVEDTEKMFDEYAQLGFKLARLLAGRLQAMNQRLSMVKERVAERVDEATAELQTKPLGQALAPGAVDGSAGFDVVALKEDVLDALDSIFEESLF